MAVLLNKGGVLWERPESLPYVLDGKQRRYYPDFLLPEYQVYLDTKNDYLIPLDAPKIDAVTKQNRVSLFVIRGKQIVGSFLAVLIPAAKAHLQSVVVNPDDWAAFRAPKRVRVYVPRPRKTKMPAVDVLKKLVWEMPLTDIAARFGVGDTAVQKWLDKCKIDRPPYGYWVRRQNGWIHEDALQSRPKNPPIPRKFTDEQIVTIRQRMAAGEKLLRLAREYQVCHKTMRDIRDRVRYKEVA